MHLKVCSHLAPMPKFASNFNIVSMVTLMLMQGMGIEGFLYICALLPLLPLLAAANEVAGR